jgi:glycosyltransferase involved in cell wall biosynthesis
VTRPRISVILSSLNHAQFVAEAIQSVLEQTFTDFELFIIDDCSEDDSWQVIQRFTDRRIIAIRNPVRSRAAYGFNEVIRHRAKGEHIAIHHSDDLWLPDKLEKQLAFLDTYPEIGAVFTRVALIDETGKPFVDPTHFYQSTFTQPNRNRLEWLRHFFLEGNCLCHPSILARRQALLDVGLYDRRLGQITDFDLWVRLCLKHEIHILDEVLTQFRIRSGEANQSGDKLETHIRGRNEWLLVLGRLLHIRDEAEFFAIFPEMRPRSHPAGDLLPFLLALRAIETNIGFKLYFGLTLLYDLFENEAVASRIFDKYGFSFPDLIALSARVDAFHGSEIYSLHKQITALENEITRIKSTVSWKLTKPLRLVSNLPRIARKLLGAS